MKLDFNFSLKIILLSAFATIGMEAFANGPDHRIEVHCNDTLKIAKKSDLCRSNTKCLWKAISQSETASVWSYDNDKIIVREVPNRNLLRISFKDNAENLKLFWCPKLRELKLTNLAKDNLRENNESQYIIGKKDNSQLRLLQSIDNECRRLKTKEFNRPYKLYYLEPSKNRACVRIREKFSN
jgi:hypothetical protein